MPELGKKSLLKKIVKRPVKNPTPVRNAEFHNSKEISRGMTTSQVHQAYNQLGSMGGP